MFVFLTIDQHLRSSRPTWYYAESLPYKTLTTDVSVKIPNWRNTLVKRVYHTWLERIRQLRPQERITRVQKFAWILAGIIASRSVHLSRIAEKLPRAAKTLSKVQRVRRFLDNSAGRVREWYEPVVRDLLQEVVAHGLEVRLLTDGIKVGFGHQLLMASLAHRRRALPIAWTWVRSARGHSSAAIQQALLAYILGVVASGMRYEVINGTDAAAGRYHFLLGSTITQPEQSPLT